MESILYVCRDTCTCTRMYILSYSSIFLEGIKFGKFDVLIAICQNNIRHFELKSANHQNLTIVQNFLLYSMFMFLFLGYVCEEHDNPADFLLDVINQCEGQTSATAGTKIK